MDRTPLEMMGGSFHFVEKAPKIPGHQEKFTGDRRRAFPGSFRVSPQIPQGVQGQSPAVPSNWAPAMWQWSLPPRLRVPYTKSRSSFMGWIQETHRKCPGIGWVVVKL